MFSDYKKKNCMSVVIQSPQIKISFFLKKKKKNTPIQSHLSSELWNTGKKLTNMRPDHLSQRPDKLRRGVRAELKLYGNAKISHERIAQSSNNEEE